MSRYHVERLTQVVKCPEDGTCPESQKHFDNLLRAQEDARATRFLMGLGLAFLLLLVGSIVAFGSDFFAALMPGMG